MLKKILLATLLLASCLSLSAKSFVWKIESNGNTLYLGGTLHILRPSDLPLPAEYEMAYLDSGTLVFETDLQALDLPETQQLIVQHGRLKGSTLKKSISEATYAELEKRCLAAGLPIAAFAQFKPSIVAITLVAIELQKMGITEEGVDKRFFTRGLKDGRKVEILETVEEQIQFICAMGEGQADDFIAQTLQDLDQTAELMPELIEAWKTGDSEALREGFIDTMKTDYPKLYQDLLVTRNENWMPKIKELLATEETEFILVGTAHLLGEDGLLATLESLGCTIEQLDAN